MADLSALYQKGLLPVLAPALIKRYNQALSTLGLAETSLDKFHIDVMGWSPEIAVEQRNFQYLSLNSANPLAIILTPEQSNKACYAPFASFCNEVMKLYFESYLDKIADLTRDSFLTLAFDMGLSRFNSPQDLLLIRKVTVHSSAGELGALAQDQASLVNTFMQDPLAWFDDAFRQRIIESAKTHGDLRARIAPADLDYPIPSSFHSSAFGGVFVLRPKSGNSYLILEQEETANLRGVNTIAMQLKDPELLEQLLGESLIELDLNYYKATIQLLKDKLELMQIDILSQAAPNLDLASMSVAQQRQRLRMLGHLPEAYIELEQFIAKLEAGYSIKYSDMSVALARLLIHPSSSLSQGEHDIIASLLLRLNPLDAVNLYNLDKAYFFEQYQTWTKAKQDWIANKL